MDAKTYINERQRLWAMKNGKPIDPNGWTHSLDDNLFRPLSEESRDEFVAGAGKELGVGPNPGKMHAVHSSAAAAVNFFEYWRANGQVEKLCAALGLTSQPIARLNFEVKLTIRGIRGEKPHPDVLLIPERLGAAPIAVEVKLREPFPYDNSTLNPTYLKPIKATIWDGIRSLRKLAQEHRPRVGPFAHLDVPQLLTHILGLRSQYSQGFTLVYLWCDVPGSEAVKHGNEVAEFEGIARQDGIDFVGRTYQEVIHGLSNNQWDQHRDYVEYLMERYF